MSQPFRPSPVEVSHNASHRLNFVFSSYEDSLKIAAERAKSGLGGDLLTGVPEPLASAPLPTLLPLRLRLGVTTHLLHLGNKRQLQEGQKTR